MTKLRRRAVACLLWLLPILAGCSSPSPTSAFCDGIDAGRSAVTAHFVSRSLPVIALDVMARLTRALMLVLVAAGLVTQANHQGRLGLELVALSGVDQRQVVLARRTEPEPELEPFIVYRAESLGDGNLFRLVPALCAFSAPRDECAQIGG